MPLSTCNPTENDRGLISKSLPLGGVFTACLGATRGPSLHDKLGTYIAIHIAEVEVLDDDGHLGIRGHLVVLLRGHLIEAVLSPAEQAAVGHTRISHPSFPVSRKTQRGRGRA